MSGKPRIFSNIVDNPAAKPPSDYGLRSDPFTGLPKKHDGVDISTPVGTPINSPADGVIYYVGNGMSGYGNVVVLAHPDAVNPTSFTLYAHLKDGSTKPANIGRQVNAGDQIAESGNTGSRTTGPHLHYEERTVNPGQAIASLPPIRGDDAAMEKAINAIRGTVLSAPAINPLDNQLGFGTWNPANIDRDDLTKLERVAQLRLSDSEFESYKTQLASIETKGKSLEESWQTTSKSGEYLGRYQMGKSTGLVEAGYMDKAGNWTEYARTQGVANERNFLNSPAAQDDALRRLTDKNAEFIVRNDLDTYIGDAIGGKLVTGAGLLLGAHNSREHVDDYIKSFGQMNGVDGNKLGISNYIALGDKVQPGQDPAPNPESKPEPSPQPSGHWDVTTQYDEQGNVISSNGRVWVIDTPAASSGVPIASPAGATSESPRAPYPSNSSTVHHAGGDTTVSYIAKGDSGDGSIRKGDLVTYVQNSEGKTIYLSVNHTEGNETRLQERVVDTLTGEVTLTYSQWVGSGPATLQFQGQWDGAGNRAGNRYTQDGETYTRSTDAAGVTHWVNERGQTRQQWLADPENPNSPNAVNGSDQQSDLSSQAEQHASSDFGKALIHAFENHQAVQAGPGTDYAAAGSSAGSGTASDAGSGGASTPPLPPEPTSPNSYSNYLVGAGTSLSPGQQDTLAAQLQSLNLGGAAGKNALSFITLPGGSTIITNVDGEIIGEIHSIKGGFVSLTSNRILEDGGVEPVISYVTPSGQPATEAEYQSAADAARTGGVSGALGLMNSIIGLQNWDSMSDLQRVAAITSIYNVVNKLSDGQLPGELGGAAAVLGLLNALDRGDIGGITISGIAVADFFGEGMASEAIGTALGIDAANVIPGLSLILALDSGNPVSILAAAANFIPGYGQVLSIAISLFGSLFGDSKPDIPMREGIAHAEWDGAGNTIVITDQNVEGGGATAAGWMSSLVNGLQTQLANTHDQSGNSYALIPNLLPAIGFQYDPDGFSLANGAKGFMVLRWTDESGTQQTRYYDGAGSRGDGTGESLAGDFMAHAQGAIAPAWQVQTTLAHFQQGQGLHFPDSAAGLPQDTGDGVHQSLQALTLALPVEPALVDSLVDVDGDGYLESTQWVAANQSMLTIDANGNGGFDAGELLSLNSAGLNSLNWLDANNDKLLDARDPAFAALRLWMDVNSDGNSGGEAQTLSQAGIVAIDFGTNPPGIIHADGRRQALTIQALTGDMLGVKYQTLEGGVLQLDEQADGSGIATLHAVNTRLFDGQAAHVHGGELEPDTHNADQQTIDEGDSRITNTSANTVQTRSVQTSTTVTAGDTRLQGGAAGAVLTGQAANNNPPPLLLRSNNGAGTAFVPFAAGSAADAIRQAKADMVQSATPTLFDRTAGMLPLGAFAAGAAAVQWPAVAAAAPASNEEAANVVAPVVSTNPSQDFNTPALTLDGSTITSTFTPVFTPVSTLAGGVQGSTPGMPASIPLTPKTWSWIADQVRNDGGYNGASSGDGLESRGDTAVQALQGSAQDNLSPASTQAFAQTLQTAAFTPAPDTALDFPVTQSELAAGTEDTTLRFATAALLANDSSVNAPARLDEPGLYITAVFGPVHGSVSLQVNALGALEVVFVPEANYHGAASFGYTVADQYGLATHASVSLHIAAVNDAPVTAGETAAGNEDTTLQFTAASLLANDSDVDARIDGDVLRITRVGLAQHGQVFLAPDGTVSFVPEPNYNGPAQFSYSIGDRDSANIAANGHGDGFETQATVSLTVLAVNDLPVVTGEAVASDEDIVLNISPALLLANDTDVDTATSNAEAAQTLSITAVGNAVHSSITLLADGTLQFTPERDYFGAASFDYTVSDGAGGLVVGTAVVNLAPVNDAPVVLGETLGFNEDDVKAIIESALLVNDSDVDNPDSDLRIVSVDNATHGTVSLNPDGSIRFAPDADYFGAAAFTYTLSDGAGGFTVGTATLNIAPVNDAPRLLGESLTLDEDTQAHFSITSLLANDNDVDNPHSDLRITAVALDPANSAAGRIEMVGGEIVFTPALNFNGQASFTYTVSDGVGGLSDATVNLTFNPVNDAPAANSELVWGKRDVSYTLTQAALLANDTDVETPNNLHISAIANVLHGAATLNPDGSVLFVPEAGYAGRGSFDYTVIDADGASSAATAQIDFSRVNINPTATDDSFTGYEDVPFSITQAQLLGNDTDADNPATDLRVTAVDQATHGSVSLMPDGTIRFVADANFYGNATFTYQVSDGEGGQTWAVAFLSVQSVNDAPIIEDVWSGRPVYGTYQQPTTLYDEFGTPYTGYSTVAVTSAAQATALYASGLLSGSSSSFYRNGQLRPVSFITDDATQYVNEAGYRVDDPLRQNGGVVAYDPDGDSSAISFSISASPQHGHAWANQYTGPGAESGLDHTQTGPYWVAETGAWQYYSQRGDTYTGVDYFTVRVTDSGGAFVDRALGVTHVGTSAAGGGGGGCCPVVIDLTGDGIDLIRPEDSNFFADVNGDGWRERIGWSAQGDGVLAFDVDGDGRVNRAEEVSFVGYKAGARTDLEGLAAFDTDGDGLLTAADAQWGRFGVFQDKNGNGRQDAGELSSLDALGMTALSLQRHGIAHIDHGNVVFGSSDVSWADGNHTQAGDVMFAGQDVALPQAALDVLNQVVPPATTAPPAPGAPFTPDAVQSLADAHLPPVDAQASINQMAALFAQYVNTASPDAPPLGVVMAHESSSDMAELSGMWMDSSVALLQGANA